MTFRVGQEVVCVDDRSTDAEGTKEISRGAVYVIRWVGVHERPYHGPALLCVRLAGLVRVDQWAPENEDCPFRASRFRPIVDRKTDISFAHEILRKASRKETVRA